MSWLANQLGIVVACAAVISIGCGPGSSSSGTDTGADTTGGTDTTPSTSSAGSTSGSGPTDEASGDPATTAPPMCDDGDSDYHEGDYDPSGASTGTGSGLTEDSGGDIPLVITVYEAQEGLVEIGRPVQLDDVVVTTPIGSHTLDGDEDLVLFVQEQTGGEFGGISVRIESTANPPTLVPGNLVRVIGTVAERDGFAAIIVQFAGDVSVVGNVAVPDPVLVALADLTPRSQVTRAYEGSLIAVEQALVVDPDPCDGQFVLAAGLRVDDLFLGQLPVPDQGQAYQRIAGPLLYTADSPVIAPRSAADLIE